MTVLERNAHRSIRQRAIDRGAYVVTQSSPPAPTGTADQLWCFAGFFVAAELKPDGAGDLEDIQRARGVEVIAAGGVFAILRRVGDVDHLCDLLLAAQRNLDAFQPTMYIATTHPERPILR